MSHTDNVLAGDFHGQVTGKVNVFLYAVNSLSFNND